MRLPRLAVVLWAAAAPCCAVAQGMTAQASGGGRTAAPSRQKGPSFWLAGLDGHRARIDVPNLRKVFLAYYFSASEKGWEGDLVAIQALCDRFQKKGFAAVAVAARAPSAAAVLAPFAVSHKIRFPVGFGDGDAFSAFAQKSLIPRTVLISASGRNVILSSQSVVALRPQLEATIPGLIDERDAALAKEKQDLLEAQQREREERKIMEAAKKIKAVEPEELKSRLDSGEKLNLAFVGSSWQYEMKHIAQAVLLESPDRVEEFFKNRKSRETWILYCVYSTDALGLSGRMAAKLYLKGFRQVSYLKGNLRAWEEKKFPLISAPGAADGKPCPDCQKRGAPKTAPAANP